MIAPAATWDALAEAVLTHDLPLQRAEWISDDDRCADCLELLDDPEHHCTQCGDHVDGLGECQSGCDL